MLKLLKMTQSSYEHYMSSAMENYANEKVQNGTWSKEVSLSKSEEEYNHLLPLGLSTPDNYFYSIFDNEEIFGYIWIAKSTDNESTAFIYDFEIYSNFQNQGFGSKAIEMVGTEAKELGFSSLALHVFGSNSRALHVYTKTGFQITDINMQKKL